jgi:hypothetical protein
MKAFTPIQRTTQLYAASKATAAASTYPAKMNTPSHSPAEHSQNKTS